MSLESNLDILRHRSSMNEAQYLTAKRIANSVPYSGMYHVLESRQAHSLDASSTVIGTEQTYLLGPYQWHSKEPTP